MIAQIVRRASRAVRLRDRRLLALLRFKVETVDRTLVAWEIAKSAGTATTTEAVEKAQAEGKAALEKAEEEARKQGADLGNAWEEASQGTSEIGGAAAHLGVPQENIALFRKHQAQVKKYSMAGLEFVGL